jgi:glutamine synthetase
VLAKFLGDAADALRADERLLGLMGGPLVDVFEVMKRDEIERFTEAVGPEMPDEVTEWEVKEYFLDL